MGQLADHSYFMADDCNYDVILLDSDPLKANEDAWYHEWQNAHLVKYLDELESAVAFRSILNWVLENRPDGNYAITDIESDLEELSKHL